MINFKEIPVSNKPTGRQDEFEFFARDFLQELGFIVESHPDRGPDDGKDLIVVENMMGISVKTRRLLVSVKHFAHSGKSVSVNDEINIKDRVSQHNCDGFLAFYSTLPSSGLNRKLQSFTESIDIEIYDCKRIENEVVKHITPNSTFRRYFPDSYLNNLDVLERTQRALITLDKDFLAYYEAVSIVRILEIEQKIYSKIHERSPSDLLSKLLPFIEYPSLRITSIIMRITSNVIYDFAKEDKSDQCINSCFFLLSRYLKLKEVPDEAIWLKSNSKTLTDSIENFVVNQIVFSQNYLEAATALNILKLIYRLYKSLGESSLMEEVKKIYDNIHDDLDLFIDTEETGVSDWLSIMRDNLKDINLSIPPFEKPSYH